MSWRNVAGVFFVDEDEISEASSIVIKNNSYEDTPLLSSLYFMLTGDYKEGVAEILNSQQASARKQGILEYIEERSASLREQKVSYIMQLEELDGTDIEKETQELTEHIQDAQTEINDLINENKAIAQQISEYQQEDAKCRVLLDRYESLISQYKADLQRLDFISKGEQAVRGMPSNDVCPFCGGEVHPEPSPGVSGKRGDSSGTLPGSAPNGHPGYISSFPCCIVSVSGSASIQREVLTAIHLSRTEPLSFISSYATRSGTVCRSSSSGPHV